MLIYAYDIDVMSYIFWAGRKTRVHQTAGKTPAIFYEVTNYVFFCGFDLVKIYYDNGQVEVTRILSSVFNALLENVEFQKVIPADYRLFQVAKLGDVVFS